MAKITFTDKELTALLWAITGETVAVKKRVRERGGNPDESETVKTLNRLSCKVYAALTEDLNKGV